MITNKTEHEKRNCSAQTFANCLGFLIAFETNKNCTVKIENILSANFQLNATKAFIENFAPFVCSSPYRALTINICDLQAYLGDCLRRPIAITTLSFAVR